MVKLSYGGVADQQRQMKAFVSQAKPPRPKQAQLFTDHAPARESTITQEDDEEDEDADYGNDLLFVPLPEVSGKGPHQSNQYEQAYSSHFK